jgi:hypothetical protein
LDVDAPCCLPFRVMLHRPLESTRVLFTDSIGRQIGVLR